jgi:hypothetical protein
MRLEYSKIFFPSRGNLDGKLPRSIIHLRGVVLSCCSGGKDDARLTYNGHKKRDTASLHYLYSADLDGSL